MKITKAKIKKDAKKISGLMRDLRRQFFELEILQSEWEYENGLGKTYSSVDALMADVVSKTKA